MKTINQILLLFFLFLPTTIITGSDVDSLTVNEIKREFLKHIPDSYSGNDSVPLLIGLHWLGSNGSQFETLSQFSVLADIHNYIVVYPNGIGNSWNAGGCCNPAVDQNIDDVQFISELIDTLIASYKIDTNRIYIFGFSNGSIMAYRIANELSEKISAIGCVSGQSFQDEISPTNPVPIIHFHALDDNAVNFDGGNLDTYHYKSVKEVLDIWKGINHCTNDSIVIRDEDNIKGYLWSSEGNENNIVLYTSKYGGHSWTMNARLGISKLIWEFFESGLTGVPAKYDTILIDTLKRSYKTHLPNSYYTDVTEKIKYPLILAFHGWDQHADIMEEYTGMSTKANRENFIVSYLNYVGPPPDYSWNYYMNEEKPDDIGFTERVLDTLIAHYPIDTSRIYAIGFSDGCGMADRLPFALPGRIKGIGTVSGMIAFDESVETYKVPLIHINYTGDFNWSNIQSNISYWIDINGCSELADTTVNARGVLGRRWENPDGKNHVILISTGGGTHAWVETEYVKATDLIWEFFETGNAIPDVDTPVFIKPASTEENYEYILFPNPARDVLYIMSSNDLSSINLASIYDDVGRLVLNLPMEDISPEQPYRVDLSDLPSGYYQLFIQGNKTFVTKKLIIVR